MNLDFSIIAEYMPFFLKGLGITLLISIISILFGCLLGFFISLGRMAGHRLIRLPFVWYINFFRGTPVLVQLFLIHFGLMPLFMSPVDPTASAIVTLSLNSAAYLAEIFRAGIQSIDRGQTEAARSLGMTKGQTMWFIILPQAMKRMIPPFGNEFIVLVKESSLASIIASQELMYWGKAAAGQYFKVWEPYLTIAVIYFVLTLSLTYILNYVEKRLETE